MFHTNAINHIFKDIDRDPLTDIEQEHADNLKRDLTTEGFCNVGRGGCFDKLTSAEIFDESQDDNLFLALADLYRSDKESQSHYVDKLYNWLDRKAEEALKDKARYAMELAR